MNGSLESIREQLRDSTGSELQAELRYLLDRLLARDRIISFLTPEQWNSVASRVPPEHRRERDALGGISRLAQEIQKEMQKEAGEEAAIEDRAEID